MLGNIYKINLKTIKYFLKYEQKSSNKPDTHKKELKWTTFNIKIEELN